MRLQDAEQALQTWLELRKIRFGYFCKGFFEVKRQITPHCCFKNYPLIWFGEYVRHKRINAFTQQPFRLPQGS
jgi:hypothetical protein